MIARIYAIALNTFREAVRHRFLIAVVLGVIGFMLCAVVLGECSQNEEARVTRDVGLAAVSLFGVLTAIILGVLLLYGEIQRRTIHTILSKPIERYEFVLGKYAGMVVTLTVLVLGFVLAMTGLLALQSVPLSTALFKALVLIYVEILVVAAIALLFSSFSTPVLSGMFTAAIWVLGRLTEEMRIVTASTESDSWTDVFQTVLSGAMRVLPDFHLFSISGGTVEGEYVSVHSEFVTWGYVATTCGYGLAYVALALVLGCAVFSRRDFS